MKPFYERVAELLDQGRAPVIAHLVEVRGSAPQRVGAKLLVHADGRTEFTIGGGALEMHAMQEALKLFTRAAPMMKDYALQELGMYCGGEVKILYEPVRGPEMRRFYHRVRELLGEGERLVIAHLMNVAGPRSPAQPKMIVSTAGEIDSSYGISPHPSVAKRICDEAAALSGSGKGTALKELTNPANEGEGRAWAFLEVIERPLQLLIFGAGHVGAKLAKLAAATELFQVEVVDERSDLLEAVRPFADRLHLLERGFHDALPLAERGAFVAIVTHSPETDGVVLRKVLGSAQAPAYLGMIGSPRKREEIFCELSKEGVPEERLGQVHTPIGLPIGGKEPGEIAVSILAEMIKVKNSLEGQDGGS